MEKIASFQVNHLTLVPGVYVSRRDKVGSETLTTFDLRMTRPNKEPVMNTAEVHTLEHLGATFLRNHPVWKDRVIYFGPMGCRTGFYLIMRDSVSKAEVLSLLRKTFAYIAAFEGEIPGNKKEECGNYLEHDLETAKQDAADYLQVLQQVTVDSFQYPEA